jgi:hypothetical protein
MSLLQRKRMIKVKDHANREKKGGFRYHIYKLLIELEKKRCLRVTNKDCNYQLQTTKRKLA